MDNLFFWFSKLAWALVSPGSLLLLTVITTLVFLSIGKQRIAKNLLITLCSILIIFAILPLGEWLLYPLESRFQTNPTLPEKVDGIIVLSGSENPYLSSTWNQVELGDGAERNLTFMFLARKYPDAKLIFSGGSGSMTKQDFKAADTARLLFSQQGIDSGRIIFERDSRNTYENAIYSYRLVSPKTGENWVLITTAWHMPRAIGIFCKANWPVIPYPVDHQTYRNDLFRLSFNLLNNLVSFQTAVKEWLGLVAYRVTSKTTALLPEQCH